LSESTADPSIITELPALPIEFRFRDFPDKLVVHIMLFQRKNRKDLREVKGQKTKDGNNKMKVALFTNNFFPRLSGVSVAVNFVNSALNRKGIDTLVVAPDYGYGKMVRGVEVFRVKSVYLMPMRMSLPLSRFDEEAISEVMDNWKPDLIHSHHPFLLGKAGLDMANRLDVPLVYTFHTLYEFFTHYFMLDTDAVKKAVRDYVVRYANRCDQVVAPTEPIREHLINVGVTTPVKTVPTGIDFTRFKKVTDEQVKGLRKNYGLGKFDGVLLYVGRISKEKNVYLCLRALKKLVDRGKNYALMYIGDGPEIEGLKAEAGELELTDRVVWGGFLDQDTLAAAYFLGDVFLFPSPSDTQGIVLYEAGAAGLPVVATETMASRAAVKPGKNGLFAEEDPDDFAEKIETILSDRDRFAEQFDTDKFSHDYLGDVYSDMYRYLIEQGRKESGREETGLTRLVDEIMALIG